MDFSREEYWSGLPFSSPGDLHNPGIKPGSPALQADSLPTELHLFLGHSLALPFFGIGTKTGHFQSCGHCWVFQLLWHIQCSTFTESSFRMWSNSTGILSPPLPSGEGNGTLLQHSCLENPMDRGAWQTIVHEVTRAGHDLATKPPPPKMFKLPHNCSHLTY